MFTGPPVDIRSLAPELPVVGARCRALPVFGAERSTGHAVRLPVEGETFGRLIKYSADRAYQAVYRICGDRDRSFDYVQGAVENIWRSWLTNQDPKVWAPGYLVRSAKNLMLSEFRRKTPSRVPHDQMNTESADQVNEVDLSNTGLSREGPVAEALAKLSPRQREVVVALYVEGMTPEEVAEHLTLARDTVLKYAQIAKVKLRNNLSI